MRKLEPFLIKAVLVAIVILCRTPELRIALLRSMGLAPAATAPVLPKRVSAGSSMELSRPSRTTSFGHLCQSSPGGAPGTFPTWVNDDPVGDSARDPAPTGWGR